MFDIVTDKVCEVCEVRRSHIMNGSRLQAVVDARILIVQYLHRIGLSHDDIALLVLRELMQNPTYCPPLCDIKAKAKGVDKMYMAYEQRMKESFAFGLMSVEVRDYCRERYKEYYTAGMKCPPGLKAE